MAVPAEKLETHFQPPEAQVIDLEAYRIEKRDRLLGELAITSEEGLYSDDPLAPVFMVLEAGNFDRAEPQLKIEYVMDMAERAKKRYFNKSFGWIVDGNDLLTDDEGMSDDERISYRSLRAGGLAAARREAADDSDRHYSLLQAEIHSSHLEMLLEWYKSDDPNSKMISSLCPDDSELPARVAEKLNFKTDRQMASIWLFGRVDGKIIMHAFSLDGLTLEGLADIYRQMGIEGEVGETALEELHHIRSIPMENAEKAVEAVRANHDNRLDQEDPDGARHYFGTKKNFEATQNANQLVESKPEAYETYVAAVLGLADSLKQGKVSPGLAKLAAELRAGFQNGSPPPELSLDSQSPTSLGQARAFMEYLRKWALPHYIYEGHNLKSANTKGNSDFIGGGVASAGADAVGSGTSYSNSCPGSGGGSVTNNGEVAQAMGINTANNPLCVTCPSCKKEVLVPKKLLHVHNIYHCPSCKASARVGGGKVDQRIIDEYYGIKGITKSPFDIFMDGWRKIGYQLKISRLAKKQTETMDELEYRRVKKQMKQEQYEYERLSLAT